MLRAKRNGLVRNVCVALGNVGDETALPALQGIAGKSDTILTEHARWAIDQIQNRTQADG
jgi:epoxyqueuosine reductase